MSSTIINSDIIDVLAVSQQIDSATTELQRIKAFGAEHKRECVINHISDYERIISSLGEVSTDLRTLASNLLNEKIAAETGKEVKGEPAG